MVELNNTTTAISSFAPTASWFGLLFIVFTIVFVLVVFIAILSNFNFYKRFKKILNWLGLSFAYFIIGLGTIICLGIPVGIFYFFITQAKKGNTVPLWVTFVIIVSYFIISFIGWLSNKFIILRVRKFESKLRKTKKAKKHENN